MYQTHHPSDLRDREGSDPEGEPVTRKFNFGVFAYALSSASATRVPRHGVGVGQIGKQRIEGEIGGRASASKKQQNACSCGCGFSASASQAWAHRRKIQPPQRHAHQELHPGHDAVAIADAEAALDQVRLEPADVIRRGGPAVFHRPDGRTFGGGFDFSDL
jgi:hypothetical protein